MEIYLVGGAVRDKLLGNPGKDNDWVVVGSTPQEMEDQNFKAVGKDFPVFIHPETKEEYALARTERKSGKGYKGFTFHTSTDITLEEDLTRRDLTINAGPGRSVKWSPKRGCKEPDIWVEQIPFNETRAYVKRVIFYASIYDWRLGHEVIPLKQRMTAVYPYKSNASLNSSTMLCSN